MKYPNDHLIEEFLLRPHYDVSFDGVVSSRIATTGKVFVDPDEWRVLTDEVGFKGYKLKLNRIVYARHVGRLDSNLHVCHRDKNPKNCHPDNLYLSEKLVVYKDRTGAKNNGWKGGRTRTTKGYVYASANGHPAAHNGYVLEHRLVMEAHLGRLLDPGEIVHHKNEIKDDNRIENLELCKSDMDHQSHHRKELSEEEILKFKEMYPDTANSVVARAMGIRDRRVEIIAKALGLEKNQEYLRFTGQRLFDSEELVRKYESGLSLRKLADEFGISHIAIRKRLINLGKYVPKSGF